MSAIKRETQFLHGFQGPNPAYLRTYFTLTTGNEITRGSGVCLCRAGKGGCTVGSLPLPKQPPAAPAPVSRAVCQVDEPSVARFRRQLAGLAGCSWRPYRRLRSRGPRCGQRPRSGWSGSGNSFLRIRMALPPLPTSL